MNIFVGKDFTPAVINEVQKDSPAMQAGLKKSDVIVSIDNREVKSITEVSQFIITSTDEFIIFTISRSDQNLNFKINKHRKYKWSSVSSHFHNGFPRHT